MIYSTIPNKYLTKDMFVVFVETMSFRYSLESYREFVSNMIIENAETDLMAFNMGKVVNNLTNLMGELDFICNQFIKYAFKEDDIQDVMIKIDKFQGYAQKYSKKFVDLQTELHSSTKFFDYIQEQYNKLFIKMLTIMKENFNVRYVTGLAETNGSLLRQY